MKVIPAALLPLLALTTLPVCAEPTRLGVQGMVNVPLGDLKGFVDSKPGPGVGVHATFDLLDGHVLRPRMDFSVFPEAAFASKKQTATNFSLGGDYLYFFAEKPEGLYLAAGLSVTRWSFETKIDAAKTTSSTTKLSLAGGLGYQWNATLGTEVRFVHAKVSSTFAANMLQLGVTVRF